MTSVTPETRSPKGYWYSCCYARCTVPLNPPCPDFGDPGDSRRARCARHAALTWICPRCLHYSDRPRRGLDGWPGCPVCGGSGWISPRQVVHELASGLYGHADKFYRLARYLEAIAAGAELVHDLDDDRVLLRWPDASTTARRDGWGAGHAHACRVPLDPSVGYARVRAAMRPR